MWVDSGVGQCLLLQELDIGLPGNSKKKKMHYKCNIFIRKEYMTIFLIIFLSVSFLVRFMFFSR